MAAKRRRARLVAARKAAGYTQEGLAAELYVDRATVINWEAGRHVPQPYLWPKLARLLGITKERLQELLAEDELPAPRDLRVIMPPDMRQQPHVWHAAVGLRPSPISLPENQQPRGSMPMRAELLSQYESLTDNYRQIDYQAGSRAVYGDTVMHLNRLLTASDDAPSELYERYIALLGDTAQLAAWLAIDGQDYVTARHFCSIALSSAEEGEDPTLHAYVLGL